MSPNSSNTEMPHSTCETVITAARKREELFAGTFRVEGKKALPVLTLEGAKPSIYLRHSVMGRSSIVQDTSVELRIAPTEQQMDLRWLAVATRTTRHLIELDLAKGRWYSTT